MYLMRYEKKTQHNIKIFANNNNNNNNNICILHHAL